MRPIDADAFKEYMQERLESFDKRDFSTELTRRIAKMTTEAFIKDIEKQPTIENFEEI